MLFIALLLDNMRVNIKINSGEIYLKEQQIFYFLTYKFFNFFLFLTNNNEKIYIFSVFKCCFVKNNQHRIQMDTWIKKTIYFSRDP